MARIAPLAAAFLALACMAASAQDVPLAPDAATVPASAPAGPPAKLHLTSRQIALHPDGTYSETNHNELQILNAAVIAQLAQPRLSYIDSLQDLTVVEAYTLKPDGRKVMVAPGAILTQQAPGNVNLPILNDLKQKVILFPDVEVGDTLVYTDKVESRPVMPGQFTLDIVVPTGAVIDQADLTVTAPKSLPLYMDGRDLSPKKTTSGDSLVYSVSYSNLKPVESNNDPISRFDQAPRISISTFRDYDTFAATYAALAQPKIAVTPEIQAQADKIVAGTADKRQQARLIYDWVSAHIRYVAVELGAGGIIPHDADSVLVNAYGDCKDQAVLYAALLKAEKIEANLALINSSNAYTIAKVPTVGSFNHVITWLPQFKLFADTTANSTVPFGSLPPVEYGKPVVVIGGGGAPHTVPVPDAKSATFIYSLTAQLDDAGHDKSSSTLTATGGFGGGLRAMGRLLQADTAGKLATALLTARGTPRASGSFTMPADMKTDPYQIGASYSTSDVPPRIAQNQSFAIPDSLRLAPLASPIFFGPVFDTRFKDAATVPCYSGTGVDDETLQFTAARHLDKLPPDFKYTTDHTQYTSHWSSDGNSVHVHREFEADFGKALCSGDLKDEALRAQKNINDDAGAARITLALVAAPAPAPAPASKP